LGGVVPQGRLGEGRADRQRVLDQRAVPGGGAGRGAGRRRGPVGEPHRRGVRQPVGRVLRLPRDRGEPGGERQLHRRRFRGGPGPPPPTPPPPPPPPPPPAPPPPPPPPP